MVDDPNKRGDFAKIADGRFSALRRVADVVSWSRAKKSLLASAVVLILVVYATTLLLLARAYLDLLPFLDPAVLELQIHLSYVFAGSWVTLGTISFALRSTRPDWRFFSHAPVQLYVVSNCTVAYLFGFFTEPYGFVTLVGGMMVALPVFGARPTRLGLLTWLLMFCGFTGLNQLGQIPYAPLFRFSPVIDGSMSNLWALGMGSINVTGGLLAAVLSFFVLGQLRERDNLLSRNQEKLVNAIVDLNESTAELEESRRQLEIRVEERTLDLKVANRNLQFEIEEREKSVLELSNLRSAMEEAIEGVARVDAAGTIEMANAAYLSMHGATASEMIGSSANRWVHVDHRREVVKAGSELSRVTKTERNIFALRADGSPFPQFMALVGVSGGESGVHYRFARDITKQSELSEQLNQAMKMEAIGRLAGGIAHDFNNLLMAILTAGEHLQEYLREMPASESESEMADMIVMAGTRAAALTTQLLDFAHARPPTTVAIDVNQSVRNVLELVGPGLGESVAVQAELFDGSLLSMGDPSRFESGLLNIALNAKDAMPRGGGLVVKSFPLIIDPQDSALAGFQPRGENQICIEMTDTGTGMDSETIAKVFEPFFTTKPAGKGTGLGLSVFGAYVREVGGAIKISSMPGEGTTCSIFVPMAAGSPKEVSASESISAREVSGTILLVEDEDIVARATQKMLESYGYDVIHCGEGITALDTFRDRDGEIDLVLLDYRMPGMTGAEVFVELRQMDPGVRAVLMSGNLSGDEFRDLEAKGLKAILPKPCSREELTTTIRKVIEESGDKP